MARPFSTLCFTLVMALPAAWRQALPSTRLVQKLRAPERPLLETRQVLMQLPLHFATLKTTCNISSLACPALKATKMSNRSPGVEQEPRGKQCSFICMRRFTWVEALRADGGAVHDGVAAVQLVLVVQRLQALLREVVAAIHNPPAMCKHRRSSSGGSGNGRSRLVS
jgi:hypothetical protein